MAKKSKNKNKKTNYELLETDIYDKEGTILNAPSNPQRNLESDLFNNKELYDEDGNFVFTYNEVARFEADKNTLLKKIENDIKDIERKKVNKNTSSYVSKAVQFIMDSHHHPYLKHQLCKIFYEKEMTTHETLFQVSSPNTKANQFILMDRRDNFAEYEKINKEINNSKYETDIYKNYGIDDNTKLSQAIPNRVTIKENNIVNFACDDSLIIDLLNCKKDLLIPAGIFLKENKDIKLTHFIGKNNDQTVVFFEKIQKSKTKTDGTYTFGFYLNGNPKKPVILVRSDYTPSRNHFNKTNSGYDLNYIYDDEFDLEDEQDEWRDKKFVNPEKSYYEKEEIKLNFLKNLQSLHPNKTIEQIRQEELGNLEREYNLLIKRREELNKLKQDKTTLEELNTINKEILDVAEEIKEFTVPIAYTHIHIPNKFYSVLFPNFNNGIDCLYINQNAITDFKIEESNEYLKNRPFRTHAELQDYCNKFSIEQLDNFDKYVYFMRTISHVQLNENIKLISPELKDTKFEENYVCSQFIESLPIDQNNDFILKKTYKNFISNKENETTKKQNEEILMKNAKFINKKINKEQLKSNNNNENVSESISENNTEMYKKVVSGNYSKLNKNNVKTCLEIITKLYPMYGDSIKTVDDVFLVCSALNFLNAFVKADENETKKQFKEFYSTHPEIVEYINEKAKKFNAKSTYTNCSSKKDLYKCFKNLVKPLMYKIVNDDKLSKHIKVSPQRDNGMSLALIEVKGVQFSFHQINFYEEDKIFNEMMNDPSTWIKWKGLRLQPIANHVFNLGKSQTKLSTAINEIIKPKELSL